MREAASKRIVCLANSRQPDGTSLVGKEILPDGKIGGWVRIVTRLPNEGLPRQVQEIPRSDPDDDREGRISYGKGHVLEILNLQPVPSHHQQENWIWTADTKCSPVGTAVQHTRQYEDFLDPVESLWVNGYSANSGLNDRIPVGKATNLNSSLRFIQVHELKLSVLPPETDYGGSRQRVHGEFRFNGEDYGFWVTDQECERKYREKGIGIFTVNEAFLTISLFPPFGAFCYKAIAAVIPL